MARTSLSVVFAGSGGAGAMTAGTLFLRAAAHAGYYGLMTQLFGPQVRGGEVRRAGADLDRADRSASPTATICSSRSTGTRSSNFAAEIPLDEPQHHHRRPGGRTGAGRHRQVEGARVVPLADE